MAVPFWQPGKLYQPGDLVRPTSAGSVSASGLTNGSFDDGASGWTLSGDGLISISQVGAGNAFDGAWAITASDNGTGQIVEARNNARIAIKPGELVSAACFVKCTATPDDTRAHIKIAWYDSSLVSLGFAHMLADTTQLGGHDRVDATDGLVGWAADNIWTQISVSGIAPAGAAFFTVYIEFGWHPDGAWRADKFFLDYASQATANPFTFRAVQAEAGFSGNSEPVWPETLGLQVVDNEVTWEAVASSNVVWEAHRILVSGAVEPTFPTAEGATVPDNDSIAWVLDPRRVTDDKAPQSKVVIAAASKIFAGDDDITPFSATINPLDWTTAEDAGYLPTGLQAFGSNPVAALGLYRSNLVVFNAEGFQMWQVDEDPQNMAILDSGPVGCTYHRSVQPVANDLVFLNDVGIRNIGIAGASTNLQAGFFGKAVDELVVAAIAALGVDEDPIGITYPGAGQYWLVFGNEAFVLTMNGGKSDMSWSTYVFPSDITDWCILGGDLYLRSGDKIWKVDEDALADDIPDADEDYTGYVAQQGSTSPLTLGDFDYVSGNPASLGVSDTPTLEDPYNVNIFRSTGSAFPTSFVLKRTDDGALNLRSLRLAAGGAGTITLKGFLNPDADLDADDPDFTQEVAVGAGTPIPVTDADVDMPGICALGFEGGGGLNSEVYLVEFTHNDISQGTAFTGSLWWHYLDMGSLGQDGTMEAFDLVIEGACDVSFGYNQADDSLATTAYAVSGDTLPGTPVPFEVTGPSIQMRLEFAGSQSWKWTAAKLYI